MQWVYRKFFLLKTLLEISISRDDWTLPEGLLFRSFEEFNLFPIRRFYLMM